jgi:TorA maturation chaperone TorD
MLRFSHARRIALSFALVAGLAFAVLPRVAAQNAERCFAETGFCVAGPFRSFWEQQTLAIVGFPLAATTQAQPPATQSQWFERQRLELHPDNPAPYSLLLGRLGAERLAQLGRDWQNQPASAPQPGCRFFAETGRNLCPPFLAAWQANGVDLGQPGVSAAESLALFGLPLTEAAEETVDGQTYLVQWFERARFELHSEPQRVLFGRLGAELLAGGAPAGGAPVVAPEAAPGATNTPAAVASNPTQQPTTRPTRRPDSSDPTPIFRNPTATQAAPTSTRIPPTATSVPPTNTPVPPTPRPTGGFQPTNPGLPPGFSQTSPLPQQQDPPELNLGQDPPATTDVTVGRPYCITTDNAVTSLDISTITISGPQPATDTIESVNTPLVTRWRWVPRMGLANGSYSITAEGVDAANAAGTATGLASVTNPLPGSGGVVRTIVDSQHYVRDGCQNGTYGERGDTFFVVLTGFSSDEPVELHLYYAATDGDPMQYLGVLPSVTVNLDGQATLPLISSATDQPGFYLVVTKAQGEAINADPTSYTNDASVALWEQRINLDQP